MESINALNIDRWRTHLAEGLNGRNVSLSVQWNSQSLVVSDQHLRSIVLQSPGQVYAA